MVRRRRRRGVDLLRCEEVSLPGPPPPDVEES